MRPRWGRVHCISHRLPARGAFSLHTRSACHVSDGSGEACARGVRNGAAYADTIAILSICGGDKEEDVPFGLARENVQSGSATFSPAPLPTRLPAVTRSPAVYPQSRFSRSMPPASRLPQYASRRSQVRLPQSPAAPRSWRRSPPAPSPPAAPPPAARRTHSPTSDGTLTCRSWQASCNCIDLPGKGAAALQVGAVVAGK